MVDAGWAGRAWAARSSGEGGREIEGQWADFVGRCRGNGERSSGIDSVEGTADGGATTWEWIVGCFGGDGGC